MKESILCVNERLSELVNERVSGFMCEWLRGGLGRQIEGRGNSVFNIMSHFEIFLTISSSQKYAGFLCNAIPIESNP